MEITREFLKANGVCEDGYKWWLKNCESLPLMEQLEKIKNKNIEWFFWTIVRLMTKDQRNEFIIFAARKVLPIFEKQFSDERPREALEAAEKCIENPTEENRQAAAAAASAAYDAAAACYTYSYYFYAYDAAASAAYAAYYACHTYSSYFYADDASYADADYNAYSAYVADAELRDEIVNYGIGLLRRKVL